MRPSSGSTTARIGAAGRGQVGPAAIGSGEVRHLKLIGVDRLTADVEDEAFADPVIDRADASLQIVAQDAAAQAIGDIDRLARRR